jgi:hypothetical protein
MIAALCCVFVIPLPAVLQQGSITRQPLGAAPFAMFIAALPLAAAWRAAVAARAEVRIPLGAGIAAIITVTAAITVRDYFSTWRRATLTAFVYHVEVTAASEYMQTLSPDASVYFYSDRHPFRIETRQFLAPDVDGSDRSSEFSAFNGSITMIDRSRPVVFVVLGRYRRLAPDLEAAYPGARLITGTHAGATTFLAFEVAPVPAISAP